MSEDEDDRESDDLSNRRRVQVELVPVRRLWESWSR